MNKRKTFRNIRTSDSKYCMDIYSGAHQSNLPLISFPCHTGPNQQFLYNKKTKQIKVKSSKKCLDAKGEKIVQNKCNTRKKSQKWNYTKKHFKSLKNRKCMDVMGGRFNNGYIITYPCHKGNNQQFE
jgi:hypothetical protein